MQRFLRGLFSRLFQAWPAPCGSAGSILLAWSLLGGFSLHGQGPEITAILTEPWTQVTVTGVPGYHYLLLAGDTLETIRQPVDLRAWAGEPLDLWDVGPRPPAGPNRFYRVEAVPTADLALAAKRPRLPELAWIPPGTFLRGSPLTEPDRWANEIRHAVVLTRGFFIGRQEVTQAAYAALMTNNPSTFKGADLPVENVSWFDATEYCARLTQRERSAGRLPDGWEYRLPTEAEWEYACRAGTVTATAFGNSLGSSWANFNGKTPYNGAPVGPFLAGTTPVGSYAPNGWGLDDFHGNVWEWCADWNDAYPSGRVVDPVGPPTGLIRVMRGGGWSDLGDFCRSAFRSGRVPGAAGSFLGFRVVLAREP